MGMFFNFYYLSLLKFNLYSIVLFLSYSIAIQNPETEKLSSYECGFEPYEDARQNFDIKFYLIAILFLIFDIETIFLIPWAITFNLLDLLSYWVIIDFILELGIGFLYLWYLNI